MKQPLVCVAMPCYNTAPNQMREALNSVASQEGDVRGRVHTVVVDDGSTSSATKDFLSSVASPTVTVLFQENAGPAAARNTAIRASTAPYVLPLDADDLISPNYLSAAVAVLQADPSAAIAHSDIQFIGYSTVLKVAERELTVSDFFATNRIVCTALFRRRDWDRLGGYDESMRMGYEDYEFWVRLLMDGSRSVKADGSLFFYRSQPGSRSTQADEARALAHTRERILTNNAEHLDVLIRAGWDAVARESARLEALRAVVREGRMSRLRRMIRRHEPTSA